jgi:hypothetical protein
VPDTVRQPRAPPLELILERLALENLFEFLDGLFAEKVLFRFLLLPFVAVGDVRV